MPKVVSVEIVDLDDPVDVYDIEVEHDQSFIVHDAVLHNSTICKARSGLVWDLTTKAPVNHSIPWNGGLPAHWNCRSVMVAVLRPLEDLPTRKRKAVETGAMQSSMDGEVAADMDYSDWLKTKSQKFQRDALGDGRWELWKEGRIQLKDLLDQSGNPMSLEELRRRYGGR